MNLEEFESLFSKIKQSGNWVESKRAGNTGVGHTFEQLIGLKENNLTDADIEGLEIKTHRIGSSSLITMFTFNRKVWRMNPLEAIRKYGVLDESGRLGMYYTMSQKANSKGLLLHADSDSIAVQHIDGDIIAEWSLEMLASQFMRKIPALIFVSALAELRDGKEWFQYLRAQLLTETSLEIIREQFLQGNILLDLRLHDNISRARNHGTAFRVRESTLPLLFKNVRELG